MACGAAVAVVAALAVAASTGRTAYSAPREYPETTRILDAAERGTPTWERLAEMCDTFGPRVTGSAGLERSLDWIEQTARADGLRVLREPVQVANWRRGHESLTVAFADGGGVERDVPVTTLGLSVGTGGKPLTADLVVVTTWDELEVADVEGNMVLMNVPWDGYNSQYRRELGTRAAARGAVAALVRSVTPFSLGTLHTGSSATAPIPSVAITTEWADTFERIQARGQRVRLTLTLSAEGCSATKGCDMVESSNIVVEIAGASKPEEVVAIGGHIDSWDVGQGALDDAGGAFAAWGAVKLLHELGLRPARTIRAVFWNAEENTGAGADAYHRAHANEPHLAVLESDGGVWTPYGFTVSEASIDPARFDVLRAVGETQLGRIGAGNVTYGGAGADTQVWCGTTVCGSQVVVDPFTGAPPVKGGAYFYFHHTNADFVSKVTKEELDRNVASFAVLAFTLAEHGWVAPPLALNSLGQE